LTGYEPQIAFSKPAIEDDVNDNASDENHENGDNVDDVDDENPENSENRRCAHDI